MEAGNRSTGRTVANVQLLGSEKTLDEKRAEFRAKRAEESRKAMKAAEAENKQMAAEEPAPAEEKKEE